MFNQQFIPTQAPTHIPTTYPTLFVPAAEVWSRAWAGTDSDTGRAKKLEETYTELIEIAKIKHDKAGVKRYQMQLNALAELTGDGDGNIDHNQQLAHLRGHVSQEIRKTVTLLSKPQPVMSALQRHHPDSPSSNPAPAGRGATQQSGIPQGSLQDAKPSSNVQTSAAGDDDDDPASKPQQLTP
jgi:hypothetical protein